MVSPCVPHPWIKQGISHLVTSLLSRLSCLAISLPSPLPPFLNFHLTTFPPHYSPNFLTLPPHSIHTPSPPSQLTTLPLSQLTSLSMTNKPLQNSNVLSLVRQGKHVWLIVRQALMKAGWWDAPLVLWDLTESISMTLIMGGSSFWFYGSWLAVKFLP